MLQNRQLIIDNNVVFGNLKIFQILLYLSSMVSVCNRTGFYLDTAHRMNSFIVANMASLSDFKTTTIYAKRQCN